MFYLKSNNIEDLFRNAAENYRLDADRASDWDKINNELHNNPNEPENDEKEKRRKRRFIFWWFLLLAPAAWFAQYAWYNHGRQAAPEAGKNAATTISRQPVNKSGDSNTGTEKNVTPEKENISEKENNTVSVDKNAPGNNQTEDKVNKPVITGNVGLNNQSYVQSRKNDRIKSIPGDNKGEGILSGNKQRIIAGEKSRYTNEKDELNSANVNVMVEDVSVVDNPTGKVDHAAEKITVRPMDLNDKVEGGIVAIDSNALRNKKIIAGAGKKTFFYAGIIAAPDLSFVKLQRTSGAGYGMGLLLGFQINKKLSIESDALLEKKFYYTDGEHFDKKDVPYLNQVDLYWVKGNCNMIDIPLNLKYTFYDGKKNNWFASGGISSYLMTKEYYDYHFKNNGIYYTRGYGYKREEKDWFSVINLSAGYEHHLGKTINLRIEPYLKLPVAGVGLGKLPLNSAGVYLGVTRRF